MHEPAPRSTSTLPIPDGGASRPSPVDESLEGAAAALAAGGAVEIAGFLFDMDGTLVDSVEAVEEAWRILAREYRVPLPASGAHGQRASTVIAGVGIPEELHDEAVARLTAIEARDGQTLRALPGIAELLDALPLPRWGIVTSAARPVAHARFGATGLPAPLSVITGDDVTCGKPDPEPFRTGKELLLERLRAAGHPAGLPAVALEDTTAGLASARAAGCLAIGVLGTASADELALHAHLVVPSARSLSVSTQGDALLLRADPTGGTA